jgi:uncharacterized membrane-anchored protein YhcB (DUF1043 family)
MQTPDSIWKFSTTFLAGVVITLVSAYFANQKDLVTREDLAIQLETQQKRLDDQSRELGELKASVIQLDVDTARIAEHLGVPPKPMTPNHNYEER